MAEATKIDVLDVSGKKAGSAELPSELFDVQTNVPLIHQVVVAQLAAARQGTQSTKRHGEVSGTGKKPFKQKGTGRAVRVRFALHRCVAVGLHMVQSLVTTTSAPQRR